MKRTKVPPCVESMRCLCACHAAGLAALEPCDTSESRAKAIASMLAVVLDTRGNPDFGQDPRRRLPGRPERKVLVANLHEASRVCRAYIERHNVGGGNWTGGQVFDASGKQVAQISYNGRAWKPGPYPQPEIALDAKIVS